MSTTNDTAPHGRGMAWATLLVSAGISLGVNLWHAFDKAPGHEVDLWFASLAMLYGIAPVLLAAFQSHSAAFVPMGRRKRGLTYLLVLLGMSLSVQAQAEAVEVFAGEWLKWVFPLLVDLSAFMALHTLMTSVRTDAERTDAGLTIRTERPVICRRSLGMPYVRAPRPVLWAVRSEPNGAGRTDGEARTEQRTEARTEGRTARTESRASDRTEARTEGRTGAVPAARTDRTPQVSTSVRDVRKGRAYWVDVLAEEIRTARREGRTWEPDYDALQTRTGWGRSWCEKTVRAARESSEARTDGEAEAARTGTDA